MNKTAYRSLLLAGLALPAVLWPAWLQAEEKKALLIVTTDKIKSSSSRLQDFVSAKEKRGFIVTVATESQYGGATAKGQDKVIIIRNWLKTVYQDYSFLLLIGDPHPKYGDVPMLVTWARHTYPIGQCSYFPIDCRSAESDYIYANLSGNWDLNGNGMYGEHGLDDGPGGIDFTPHLIVGRIPVYFNEVEPLDQVLGHTIDYMNMTQVETAYRHRFILPAAIYYFEGQYGSSPFIDGSDNAEWFVHNYLKPRSEISYTRLYEREGVKPSKNESELPLSTDNIAAEWAKGAGMVFWFAHGSPLETARMIWSNDDDHDNLAQNSEVTSKNMIATKDVPKFTHTKPGFVLGVSCEIGSAETPNNISYKMLIEGSAVGVASSTSLTSTSATDYTRVTNPMDTETLGADTVGAVMFDSLMKGGFPAAAFYKAKLQMGTSEDVETYAARMMLNYYGDPTLKLTDSIEDIIKEADGGIPGPDGGSTPADAGSDGGGGEGSTGCSCSTLGL